MATLRDIRRRIRSVESTQKITRAMKLVAAAKLRRAQERVFAARPYAGKMAELLGNLVGGADTGDEAPHPLLARREGPRRQIVAITADRGLAGAFNSNVVRRAVEFIRQSSAPDVTLVVVGRKGRDFFRRRGYTLKREMLGFWDRLPPHPPRPARRAEAGGGAGEGAAVDYIYEPGPAAILGDLLPRHVRTQVFRALMESLAGEYGARMTAMEAATRNAKEMIGLLTIQYNKARQEKITKELLDIVGGAEALKQGAEA